MQAFSVHVGSKQFVRIPTNDRASPDLPRVTYVVFEVLDGIQHLCSLSYSKILVFDEFERKYM